MSRETNLRVRAVDGEPLFGKAPTDLGALHLSAPRERQYILRMLVRKPGGELLISNELLWLDDFTSWCQRYRPVDWFIYITVRHGPVASKTDDLWHVDGFSMRIAHPVSHDFIWASHSPTQYLLQPIAIPIDFDPLKHNIHWYFQDVADVANAVDGLAPHAYMIDPYVIHRRPPSVDPERWRTFVRVSFVPIEIRDDTCTVNPLLPTYYYGSADFRSQLSRYPV